MIDVALTKIKENTYKYFKTELIFIFIFFFFESTSIRSVSFRKNEEDHSYIYYCQKIKENQTVHVLEGHRLILVGKYLHLATESNIITTILLMLSKMC